MIAELKLYPSPILYDYFNGVILFMVPGYFFPFSFVTVPLSLPGYSS